MSSDIFGLSGKSIAELNLNVRVLSFVLQGARRTCGPKFHLTWMQNRSVARFAQTDERLWKLYRDKAEHSHTSAMFNGYPGRPNLDLRAGATLE